MRMTYIHLVQLTDVTTLYGCKLKLTCFEDLSNPFGGFVFAPLVPLLKEKHPPLVHPVIIV